MSCPAEPVCPANDGCQSTQPNGEVFEIACSTDYVGQDVQDIQGITYSACLLACSNRADCSAVSYTNSNCYLKDKGLNGENPAPVANSAVNGALLISSSNDESPPPGDGSGGGTGGQVTATVTVTLTVRCISTLLR